MIFIAKPNPVGFLGMVHCICQKDSFDSLVGAMFVYKNACVLVCDPQLKQSSWTDTATNIMSFMTKLQNLYENAANLGQGALLLAATNSGLHYSRRMLADIRLYSAIRYRNPLLRRHI